MKKYLLILSLFFCQNILANDSTLIIKLFQNLLNKQQLQTVFFVEGSFTSLRQYHNSTELQPDNNIFFTALIAYTLQDLKPYLHKDELVVADTIINRTKRAFSYYKNKKRNTYNFWRTDVKDNFFPNDDILPLLKKKLKLPDDLDDTSIILAVLESKDSSAKKAHELMQQFANKQYNTIENTFDEYKNVEAYSTWYGVKMPVDFDFGVHCNILNFVNKYNLTYNKNDSATLQLLVNMIDNKLYLHQPLYISPYYAYTPVLLYHIARLMSTKKIDQLEKRKPIIIADIKKELEKQQNILYKTLLINALLKLDETTTNIDFEIAYFKCEVNTTDFIYYTGHIFGHLNNTIKNIANSFGATQFKWYCSAFNDCLVLENLILRNRKKN